MKLNIDPQLVVPEYPKIPEDCHIVITDKSIQIYGMEESLSFTGVNSLPLLKQLLPLLDGTLSVTEIMNRFPEKEYEHLAMILKYLYFKGFFEKYAEKFIENKTNINEKRYYARCVDVTRYCKNRDDVYNKIKNFPLLVISNGGFGEKLINELKENDFNNLEECLLNDDEIQSLLQEKISFNDLLDNKLNEDTHILIALNRNIPQFFSLINKYSYTKKNNLTISYLSDKSFIIGPTIIPDETACFNCLEKKVLQNSTDLDNIIVKNNSLNSNGNKPFSHTRYNVQHFISMLIAEVVNIATFINYPKTFGSELEYNFIYSRLYETSCYRLPSCEVCSKKVSSNNYVFAGDII